MPDFDPDPPAVVREADSLAELAARINAAYQLGEQTTRKGLSYFNEVGMALLAAKAKCPRGRWLSWLKANVKFGQQHASRCMRLARDWDKLRMMRNLADALRALTEEAEDETEEGVTDDDGGDEPDGEDSDAGESDGDSDTADETSDTDPNVTEAGGGGDADDEDNPGVVVEMVTPEQCKIALTAVTKSVKRVREYLSGVMASPFADDLRAFLAQSYPPPCPLQPTGEDLKGGAWGSVAFRVREYTTDELDRFAAFVGTLKVFFDRQGAKAVEVPEEDGDDPWELGRELRDDGGPVEF